MSAGRFVPSAWPLHGVRMAVEMDLKIYSYLTLKFRVLIKHNLSGTVTVRD